MLLHVLVKLFVKGKPAIFIAMKAAIIHGGYATNDLLLVGQLDKNPVAPARDI